MTAPTVDDLLDVSCPSCRAALVTALGRAKGWLPGELSRLRRDAIVEARQAGLTPSQIAARVGLTSPRITQITNEAREVSP